MKLLFATITLALSLFTVGVSGFPGITTGTAAHENQKSHERLEIGKKGNLETIVVTDPSCPVSVFAAEELQRYFEKITGKRLQIVKSATYNDDAKAIYLSPDKNTDLKWDGFKIRTGKKGIVITAKEPRGLLYGAYQLLEESGCSFVYLGEKEQVIPRLEKVGFAQGDRVFNPVLEHRGVAPYGLQASSVELGRSFIDWMGKNKLNYILISEDRPSDSPGTAHGSIWKEVSAELLPELQKRGFVVEMSEHCTHVFFPRTLFAEHPDWFAMNGGVRKLGKPPYSGQMCYSNHDAVEYYASAVAQYAAVHPEFHAIGTWPLDGGNYCECEGCKDPQTVFKAAMKVAEKVKKVRPDMIVEHLAYQPQTWQPPAMEKIPENMSVLWCPDNGKMDELASEWVRKSKGAQGVYQFEYYMGDNYRSRANVLLYPELAVNNVQHAQEMGFRGIISLFLPMENWWRSCFNYWFYANACWDTKPDIKAYLHGYCQKYYGDSATEIEKVIETIFSSLHPEPSFDPERKTFSPNPEKTKPVAADLIRQLDGLVQKSEGKVKERINRLKVYVEYNHLYNEAISKKTQQAKDELIDYCKSHSAYDMVIMPVDYFNWRNIGLFAK